MFILLLQRSILSRNSRSTVTRCLPSDTRSIYYAVLKRCTSLLPAAAATTTMPPLPSRLLCRPILLRHLHPLLYYHLHIHRSRPPARPRPRLRSPPPQHPMLQHPTSPREGQPRAQNAFQATITSPITTEAKTKKKSLQKNFFNCLNTPECIHVAYMYLNFCNLEATTQAKVCGYTARKQCKDVH